MTQKEAGYIAKTVHEATKGEIEIEVYHGYANQRSSHPQWLCRAHLAQPEEEN